MNSSNTFFHYCDILIVPPQFIYFFPHLFSDFPEDAIPALWKRRLHPHGKWRDTLQKSWRRLLSQINILCRWSSPLYPNKRSLGVQTLLNVLRPQTLQPTGKVFPERYQNAYRFHESLKKLKYEQRIQWINQVDKNTFNPPLFVCTGSAGLLPPRLSLSWHWRSATNARITTMR